MENMIASKESCFKALSRLLKNRKIDTIYTNEILDEANVSRSQFYRLFKDKYDLLDQLIDYQVSSIYTDVCPLGEWRYRITAFLTMIKDERTVLSSYRGYDKYRYMQTYYDIFARLFELRFKRLNRKELTGKDKRTISFFCAGISYVISDWVFRGCLESPDEIAGDFIDNFSERILTIACADKPL